MHEHATVVEARHENVTALDAVEADAFPLVAGEAVGEQHLAGLILVDDRGIGRGLARRHYRRGVHEARMEDVGGVLHVELPVAAIFQREIRIRDLDLAIGRAIDEIIDDLGHAAEMIGERRRIVGQIGEHEAAVARDLSDPLHMVLRIAEVEVLGIALGMRHRGERAVRAERPGVIGTRQQAARAAVDHAEPRAAMGTAVVQHVDLPVAVAGHDHLVRGEAGAHEIARLLELALVRHVDPQPAEDALLFEREYRRVGIGAAMHVIRPHHVPDVLTAERRNRVGIVHENRLAPQFNNPPKTSGNAGDASNPAPGASGKTASPSRTATPDVSLPNSASRSIAVSASPRPRPATALIARR